MKIRRQRLVRLIREYYDYYDNEDAGDLRSMNAAGWSEAQGDVELEARESFMEDTGDHPDDYTFESNADGLWAFDKAGRAEWRWDVDFGQWECGK